jgi:hypothetical protein
LVLLVELQQTAQVYVPAGAFFRFTVFLLASLLSS